jgi:3,4-dihydroxy 2-butanone 4-phosphate synthase/GTP cyclohydrolase II
MMAIERRPDEVAPGFADIDVALDELRRGGYVIVADSEAPDSGVDVVVAAEHATPEAIAFLAIEARGVLYLVLTAERGRELDLPPLQPEPGLESWTTAEDQRWKEGFRVLIDARDGISTGISAHDRARTVALAIDPEVGPEAFVRPGHMLPVIAHPHGVIGRPKRNEAFVELPRLAGLRPAGVASSVMTAEGEIAALADILPWSERHGIPLVTVDAVRRAAAVRTRWLRREDERALRTTDGTFPLTVLRHPTTGRRVRIVGTPAAAGESTPLAVVAACSEGEALGDERCPHRGGPAAALARLAEVDTGVVVVAEATAPCAALGSLDEPSDEVATLVAGALADAGCSRLRTLSPDDPPPAWLADYAFAIEP